MIFTTCKIIATKNPIHRITYLLLTLCVVINMGLIAQSNERDSLFSVLLKSKQDTNKVNVLNSYAWTFFSTNIDSSIIVATEALDLSENILWLKGQRNSLNNLGTFYEKKEVFPQALDCYSKSIELCKRLQDEKDIPVLYNRIGLIYSRKGDHVAAIKWFLKSSELCVQSSNKKGMARAYYNIGNVYVSQMDYDKGLEYMNKSLKIRLEIMDTDGQYFVQNGIGIIKCQQGKYEEALKVFSTMLKPDISKERLATIYTNIGEVYRRKQSYDSAIVYENKALSLKQSFNDNGGVANCLNNLAKIYVDQKKYSDAKNYYTIALKLSLKLGDKGSIMDNYQGLASLDSILGNWKSSLESYKLSILFRDSVFNEKNTKQITQQEMQYEFDKKQTADSLKVADERKITELKFEQEKKQRYYLYIGLAVVIIFSGFIYNRFKLTQRQKRIIEFKEQETQKQKHLVYEKNKEITDSINYAKRIQEAILPSFEAMQLALRNGFVLYKPKDIVAGDFYWMEQEGDKVFFAAADCTGHGVPGAMVSVVCSNALTKALIEEKAQSTGELLDKTKEIVVQRFAKSGGEVKDGMDISLCAIDFRNMHLQWSGANNPLWIVRNNEIIEFKPDKQPIGKHVSSTSFTTHNIELQNGDSIYIFTDGYQDQFGGAKGKKYKAAQMKEKLLAIQSQTMDEQKDSIDNAFVEWKGDLEQVDDVCVIGLRV